MDSQNSTLQSVQTCKDREAENVKVFVLTPSDLASIGLITKVENGQAVLLSAKKTNNVDTSTTLSQIIAKKRSLNFKDVATVETPHLKIAPSTAAASPPVTRNPKRKGPDEQDVTITIVKQNDINAGLNVATAKNHDDVTVTVSKLASTSTSILKSDVISSQIKRSYGNNAHTATTQLGNATNSPNMKSTIVNNPCGPTAVLSSSSHVSQTKTADGINSNGNTNVLGKSVITSPVKMGCKSTPLTPYEEKEKWTPNLIKRTCKLVPMTQQGQSPQTSQQQTVTSSANNSCISSYSNNPARPRPRRMLSGFSQYWLNSLEDVGYIRCPLRACNYISLSFQDMSTHYATCAGVSITSENMCPVCQKRLNTAENVNLHLIRSHGPKSKHREEVQSKASVNREPKENPPPRLLVRKRGYSKVHKISWSISLEQKGYIKCLFQNCGFLALNMEEMIKHYGICNGSGSSAHIPCPFCNGRVENLNKLDKHILISHAEESKQGDTQTEAINVVGTPKTKPVHSQNNNDQKDSQKMTMGQSATPESFAVNVSEVYSHQMDQPRESTEYIVPEILCEDFEDRVNSIKSFSSIPTKNEPDSLQNKTGSYGENNFLGKLGPEKPKDILSIRLSDEQSTHCEVVGVESNHSQMPAQEKISDEGYNVQISETVIVNVDPQDVTEAEAISANRLDSGVRYETISLHFSDIADLEESIRVTPNNMNSIPSSDESATTKININKSNKEEEIPHTSSAVSGCNVSVIQANTLNMNKSDCVFSSKSKGTDDIQGVISVSDFCRGNSKQEILTKSSSGANCFNILNVSGDKSNISCNDAICADNLNNSNKTWQKTDISCVRYIQSKMLILPDHCDTEIKKPLSNVVNTGSAPNVQHSLVCRDEDTIDIDLLSYSALSAGDTIVYSNHQWESKLPAVSSGLGSSPAEKGVTDKSHLKTYSKKNSPSSFTDQIKIQESPCYADSEVIFDRPSYVNFEEDVFLKKDTEATVAAASTLCHSNLYNKVNVPVGDGSSEEYGESFLEECQLDQAPPKEESKCSGTLATGAIAEKKLLGVNICSHTDGVKVDITPGVTCAQETDVHGNSLTGTAASADDAKAEEEESFHCLKFVDRPESAIVSSVVQKCVGVANTATVNNESISCVSDASFTASSVENICDVNQENRKEAFCNVQMNACEIEASKGEQNELITKPSIENFVQEMNIDYINSEADKFIIEDESLSMYLNNSDEFQDKNLLENDSALTPIGSCEHDQGIVMSDNLSTKDTVNMIVKEKCENTSLKNTVGCDMLSSERRETITLIPVNYDKIPDVAPSTEVDEKQITNEMEVSVEVAGCNMQNKDETRHSSYSDSTSVIITSAASDKKVKVSSTTTNMNEEVIDNSCLSTATVMEGSGKNNIETQCENRFQEDCEASTDLSTTNIISNLEDTSCTLCMEEQDNSVSVIRSSQKSLINKTEHYDTTKEYNSNKNCFGIRSEDLVTSGCNLPVVNSTKEEPSSQSISDVLLTHTENTVEPHQYEGNGSIYQHDKKSECVVDQSGREDDTEMKVKDQQSEKIVQAHKELNDHCENNSLTQVRETKIGLNEIDTKSGVLSECLPISEKLISNQERNTSFLGTLLITDCKSETEGYQSSCLHANDTKSEKTETILMCQQQLSTDDQEVKVKDESNENMKEKCEVHNEDNSSPCVRESTIIQDDIEMKNVLPVECSLDLVLPLSNQTSKAEMLADSSVKESKSGTEDVVHSGLCNPAVIVEQKNPSNTSKPELHLSRDSSDLNISGKDEDCAETPTNPPVEKESCEEENLGNLKDEVADTVGNESSQPQQSEFSQNCSNTTLSAETEECDASLLQVDENSNSETLCDVSKNTTSPLSTSKICRKRKNSESKNTDNSNSKIQILEFDSDKIAMPSSVKATAEIAPCQSKPNENYKDNASMENSCDDTKRKQQLSSIVSDSQVMSASSKYENTEDTSASLKTPISDNDGDISQCDKYADYSNTKDVNVSKVNSQNGELFENNSVGASEVMKSNNNQVSENRNDTVDVEGIKSMNATESVCAEQVQVHRKKRKNSQQELHTSENCAEIPLEKKKLFHSPTQTTDYPGRSELSTAKCVYNTRHKGTLHTVHKLDQASGFCSPVIGRGRGRGRGRGTVKEETLKQEEGPSPCGQGRGKEGLTGRGSRKPRGRGRGRGRGRDTCTQELEGCCMLLDKTTAHPALVETELVTKSEANVIADSDVASNCNKCTGTVALVKRKIVSSGLKSQPTESTVADENHCGKKKEDNSSNSNNLPHYINTDIKSTSCAAIAGLNESEENDKAATRECEEKNEGNIIHSNFEDESFLKDNKESVMTSLGRGSDKRCKTRCVKVMVCNDSMFSSEDGQSNEGNTNNYTLEDEKYSPRCRKKIKREARRASTSNTPSIQNTHNKHITNVSVDYEGSNTVTTREGDQDNGCKIISSEIEESFLKENEDTVMLRQRRNSGKESKTRDDEIMVNNASVHNSEDGQTKEADTIDNTFEDDAYSSQHSTIRKKAVRRASTNKISSKRNGKSHENNIINENFDNGGGNIETTREGNEKEECKNISSNFDAELMSKEDGVETSLRRGSRRRGRPSKCKVTAGNDSMLTNEDDQSDGGNTIDNVFEDEEYLPQSRERGRRASNRVSSIQEGENNEDSMTNENVEDGLLSGRHGRRGTRQGIRQRSRTGKLDKTVYGNDSNEEEPSGEGSYSDVSCEDNEYSPYQKRKRKERRKRSWNGGRKRRGRGRGRGAMLTGRDRLQMMGEDVREFQVKCAKCHEEVTNWSFESHNSQNHNGLAWIEGQEPIDTSDEKLVQRILFKVRKHGKKWFTCDTCKVVKRSVVGFISHLQFCQKTSEEREAMKERCPFCERCLIPASMRVHLQLHRSEQERQQQEEELIASSNQARKHKRAAAEKATTLMQEFMKVGEDDEPIVEQQVDKDELFKQIGSTRPSNSLRGRWKTALNEHGKANCNNPGCHFEATELSILDQHYLDCPMAPRKGYVCKLCEHHCNEEAEIREHLKDHERSNPAEETDSSGVEEDDGELFHERTGVLTSLRVGKPKKQRYKVANKMNFLATEASGTVFGDRVFAPALRWTAKFHKQHYKDSLFPLFHTEFEDWTAVEESLLDEYFPVAKESMKISHLTMKGKVVDIKQQNLEWRKYNLFEAAVIDDAVTMFVGGPVWSMAWCPLPFRLQIKEDRLNKKQYLAITCHRSMDDQYSVSRSYSEPGLIQVWCFEELDNLKSPPIPSLAFAIAHNYGVVWCMEWCPSGCYERRGCEIEEDRLRRLGLLAAACSDGCIHIFSVCHPDEVIKRECDSYPVYKTEPVVSLMLEEDEDVKLGGTDWQCLRLSWSKVKGHRIIAGSFSNGMVALWDIETASSLLYRICGKRKLIFPYHTFQPHGGPVTALAMNPFNERYLMTGSYDRTCKFWDIHDTAEPISSTFKGLVTDGIWLTHWPSAVCAYDDVYSRCHTNSTLTPVRNFGYSPYPLMAQNSVAWTLSHCDWVNSVAQGTSAGELSAIFLHQLLIGVDTEKGMKNKRMILSYAEIINLKESVSTCELTGNANECEKEEVVPCETVEQQTSAAESMTADVPSSPSSNSQAVEQQKSAAESMTADVPSSLSFNAQAVEQQTSAAESMTADVPSALSSNAQAVEQQASAAESMTADVPSSLPSNAQDSSGTDSGKSSENENVANATHSESECGSSMNRRVDELLPSESRDGDKSVNYPVPTVKEQEELHGSQQINDSTNENSSYVEYLQKTELCPEDDTDTLTYDDSQSVLSSWVNSPTCSQASDTNKQCNKKDIRSEQSDSQKLEEATQENLVLNPRTYSEIEKNFGIVLCDFPTDDFSEMPKEARLWMRQSDQMRMFPTEMYPAVSINRVAWNPNFKSCFWVASGYQNGLVRLKCVSAMYTPDVKRNMLRIRDAYS